MKTQLLLIVATILLLPLQMSAAEKGTTSKSPMVAYLFAYFNSNAPEDEQICFALSDDGYNYVPLNGGRPVIESDTIALTQCVRDPHILRCEDGKTFYMVCTDMRSSLGWSSNRGMEERHTRLGSRNHLRPQGPQIHGLLFPAHQRP